MKRIAKITVIMLLVFLMSPLAVFAEHKGYKEVKLTKKNFTKYFEVTKMKKYNVFGDYGGYEFILKSKLLKKGYYLYKCDGFSLKYTFKNKYKYKYKKKTYKRTNTVNRTTSSFRNSLDRWSDPCDYKYAKAKSFKISKVKGKLIFIESSNVVKIKKTYDEDGKYSGSMIILKYPYDEDTDYESHWDEKKDKEVIDYYCMDLGKQNVFYNGKIGIKGETIVR